MAATVDVTTATVKGVARPPDTARRAELIAATLDDLAAHGLAEFTLRGLAERLGTSARMLVHYFGSRDRLLAAAFAEHRSRVLAQLDGAAEQDPRSAAAAAWSAMTTDRAHFTVMYQLLTAALTEDHPAARPAVTAWVDYAAALLPDHDPATATALASGLKGLLLDRMVTGEDARCDAAAALLIDRLLS